MHIVLLFAMLMLFVCLCNIQVPIVIIVWVTSKVIYIDNQPESLLLGVPNSPN